MKTLQVLITPCISVVGLLIIGSPANAGYTWRTDAWRDTMCSGTFNGEGINTTSRTDA